ncbi:ubiquinol-cytochrome c reductase [Marinagarivorans algicola]|uniref:ubiquinol-cytochrome c reductase n=1 Tax=Marinagarivorans algicola TaxID=1513270 RepID=UPI0006B9EB61|nr:cytochrome b N-terminal domain-containing protein [Marinagarivorans algicola]
MNGLLSWIDARLPVVRAWDTHMGKYYAPKNFNFWYFFGVLSILVLVNQLLTGIFLTMHYEPSVEGAFASVEYIMRDVPYGWLLRYMHSTGASAFFVVVYLHMFRGLMYGSYKAPRELVWIFGMLIYLVLMAEAFMGYVLPWGQMSYWGAQVIVNLFGAIPVIGEDLVQWIRGDYLISGATLSRFFALHVVAMPIVLLGLVVMHILALHEVGSNNPDGIDIKKNKDENGIPKDGVPFHPFYTVHDLVGITVFLFVFCAIIFFAPEMGGYFLEFANFEVANGLKTPEHIAPVWYFTPFYAILRAVTIDIGPLNSKFLGFVAMGAAIAILFVLPWLDRSPVKSMRYKGWFSRVALIAFAAVFVILGYLGVKESTPGRTILSQVCSVLYFAYFLGMPFWTSREKCQPVPERVQQKGLSKALVFGGLALFAVLVVVPIKAVAAGGAACGSVPCEHFHADFDDKASLQRGAQTFVNYCMGCHSIQYSRFGRVADDLEIPRDVMREQLIFGDEKIGDLMVSSMDPVKSKAWFGAMPPDLSLVSRSRNPDWLLTYFLTFYKDESRPTGVNNKVFANVGMPHALLELQGLQECAPGPKYDDHGHVIRNAVGELGEIDPCGSLVVGNIKGTMSPSEYRAAMVDLVNFIEYVGEPIADKRQTIGIYVLLFLMLLFVCVWFLNREYWRDIH